MPRPEEESFMLCVTRRTTTAIPHEADAHPELYDNKTVRVRGHG